jgi:Abnormal spindle-like microcephaly-assoc'd, ASPM-SPD-2-Hydin
MHPHSKGLRAVGVAVLASFACITAAVGQTAASLDSKRNQHPMHGPAILTEKGNYSFRGLQVPIGKTSLAIQIPIRNGGDVPLTGVSAVTHGDFVVTGTSCTGQLPASGDEKSQCLMSVAFHPTASGSRTGDLTIAANGALPMVVPLLGGIPIDFGNVGIGETSSQWTQLTPSGPLTGSVTGPFAMVLQAPYVYGSIDGINFGPSNSGTPSGGVLWLGVEFQATTSGTQTGTVTLSDGSTYDLTASVAGGVQLLPASVDFQSIALKTVSGTAPFVFTNGSSGAVTISGVQATAPFTSTNDCGSTVAAGASCTVDVTYNPTALGASTGQLTISTSSGNVLASLAGSASPNYENASVGPDNLFLTFTRVGDLSPPQIITIKNYDGTSSLNVVGFDGINICSTQLTSNCYQVTPNTCSTLAPLASCQIQMQYLFGVPSGNTTTNINLQLDRGSSGADYTMWTHMAAPASAGQTGSLIATPASLTFLPTAIGQVSDEQLITLENNSNQPIFVDNTAPPEFSVNSGCGVLAPGDICLVHVRFAPTGAGPHFGYAHSEGAPLTSYNYAVVNVIVQGYGIPTTALASPSYAPLIEPVFYTGAPAPDGIYVHGVLPVKNIGSAPLVLANVYIANQPQQFSVDPTECAQPLAPGAECNLNLTWNPEFCPPGGPDGFGYCYDSNYLILESNAVSSIDEYSLQGEHYNSGTSPGLPLSPGPFTIEFGRAQIGTPVTQTLSFNGQDGPIPAISITGSAFQLVNGCASFVGSTTQSCIVQIIYAPTSPGFSLGGLRIASTSGLATDTLAGYAIPAQVTAPPIVFPNTLVYQNPPNQTGSVTNITSAPLALGAIYQPNLEFQIANTTCGTSLASNATCSITVAFTPYNNIGNQTSSLRFSFGVDDGVETIPILAPVTSLTITPASANFGSVTTGQVATQAFTVQNIGDPAQLYGTAVLQGAALSGVDAGDFSLTANTCTAGITLTGAQTCSATVQFKPSASGVRNGVLTVTTSNAGYTSAILAGTGNAPSGCGVRHRRHHDKDDGERECDCDEHHHRNGHECRTKEHQDNDHELPEK